MIWILGERPGPNTDPSIALFPHTPNGAASKLIRLLRLSQEGYLANTTRLNAVDDSSSTASTEARLRAKQFLLEAGPEPFIVLGKQALRAMPSKYRKMQFGEILDNVLLLPHTSGVNRVWNDQAFYSRMQEIAGGHIDGYTSDHTKGFSADE